MDNQDVSQQQTLGWKNHSLLSVKVCTHRPLEQQKHGSGGQNEDYAEFHDPETNTLMLFRRGNSINWASIHLCLTWIGKTALE